MWPLCIFFILFFLFMFYSYRLSFARWRRFSSLRRPIFSPKEKEIRAQVERFTSKASVMLHSGKRCAQMNLGQDLIFEHAVNCFCRKSFSIGPSQRRKSIYCHSGYVHSTSQLDCDRKCVCRCDSQTEIPFCPMHRGRVSQRRLSRSLYRRWTSSLK